VIPGIEFTTESKDNELHILGLFLDYKNSELFEILKKIQDDRVARIRKIVAQLKQVNVNLEENLILESSLPGTVGRPHVARMLVKMGFARDLKDAFMKYLVKDAPGYVPHFKLTPVEAVKLIKRCKGAPVFAHPGISRSDEIIPELIEAGLCGLEVFYPSHGYQREAHYLALCEKYKLIPTGGTDFHGGGSFNEMELGEKFTTDENVAKLEAITHG
jgi:predicted metal-dependent phosphoesterase TrpH